MKTYTVHTRYNTAPVLVREGFSWAAMLFGPLWLLLQRAWLSAIIALAVFAALFFVPPPWRGIPVAAVMILLGLVGRDLRRFSLANRGFDLDAVVIARNQDAAFLRYMDAEAPP